MKSIPRVVWIVPTILLVIATARLPYGYYTFTRIVTCGIPAWIAYAGFQEGPAIKVWSIALALIAVLFNPILPIHLDRSTWFYLDLGAAGVFVAHLIFVRQKLA
jgi:Family of unknown function (DUF6804)